MKGYQAASPRLRPFATCAIATHLFPRYVFHLFLLSLQIVFDVDHIFHVEGLGFGKIFRVLLDHLISENV